MNNRIVITESKEVELSQLTPDCWLLQIEGLEAYKKCELKNTQITDEEVLLRALCRVDFLNETVARKAIEIHKTPQKVLISDQYDQKWLDRLTMYYNIEKSKMEFNAKGIECIEAKDAKGRIQLRAKFPVRNNSKIQVRMGGNS
jgi:hypothetical protein